MASTEDVRAFYARFPYPNTGWQIRADSFPALLLSLVDREPWPRTLQLLDAGCGTGAALVPVAAMHPECRVVGLDLSEASLTRARAAAEAQGVQHLELLAGDLADAELASTLLEGSPSGFDLIWLSGVLHHCEQPAVVLQQLARLLAHDGVLSVMVYGRFGRQPVDRMARALALARPEAPVEERAALARSILADLEPGPVLQAPFDDALGVSEQEFADRYLHPLARSYGVAQLFDALDAAGLRPLRWLEPRAWSPEALLGRGPAAEALQALPERTRWQVIEQLFDHQALELLVCHRDRASRPGVSEARWLEEVVDWNPQATLRGVTRRMGGAAWEDSLEVRLRAGPYEPLAPDEARLARLIQGPERVGELAARAGLEAGAQTLRRMLEREWLFRPTP
ncbi:MAG: methyltransferase domain-containing protein [Alphaproteobacteria bacterium]|nr:methyltransferase domain-containing protein [Alphaproteobacteria bacterium]